MKQKSPSYPRVEADKSRIQKHMGALRRFNEWEANRADKMPGNQIKIISERPRDLEDVKGILRFRKEDLDYSYLEPRIQELADLLDRPGIFSQWETWKKKS